MSMVDSAKSAWMIFSITCLTSVVTSLALCSKHGKHTMERPLDPIRLLTVICYARGLRVSTLEGQASVERQGLFLFQIESSAGELDVQGCGFPEMAENLILSRIL